MKTFAVMTLGCKVNDYEATCIRNDLSKTLIEVPFDNKADVYVIFTCCVTNIAEAKTRKFIHKARRNNPNGFVVTIGCLSQIKGDSDDFNNVDLIIGSSLKNKAVELILALDKGNKVQSLNDASFEEMYLKDYPGKSRAFLKIQDGCNQYCSYCIIPYARGKERSIDHNSALNIANELSKNYKEIVLTGIHTGRYFDGEYNLYKLLKLLLEKTNIETIRLSSIEMTEISDEIIELIKNSNNRIAHHLHIPVQSCSDSILKAMNRPYTFEEYLNRIEYIREKIPNISISTDLIVGFPNETDDDFNDVISNLKRIKFSFIHCFPYSRKQGTKADKMSGHIKPEVKKNRAKTVSLIEKDISKEYTNRFINKEVFVLIEKTIDNKSFGYSKEYLYIEVSGQYKIGDIIKVKVTKVLDDKIVGEHVSR